MLFGTLDDGQSPESSNSRRNKLTSECYVADVYIVFIKGNEPESVWLVTAFLNWN